MNENKTENDLEEKEKKIKIDYDEEISPEFYYFCINRYYERLFSIITNHGGDAIFQGNGVYAIWPPEKKEVDLNINNSYSNSDLNLEEKTNIIEEKNRNLCLRAIQCALEIQKNIITEIKNGCSFISKIGCSVGECKFIIFQGINNKYSYIVIGNVLTNACECSKKDKKGGQIIIGNKIINLVQEYFNLREFLVSYNFWDFLSSFSSFILM